MKAIKTLTLALPLLVASTAAHSYCRVPQSPIGDSQFAWKMYYQDVDDYNRCMYRQAQEQQRRLQDMQERQQYRGQSSWGSRYLDLIQPLY